MPYIHFERYSNPGYGPKSVTFDPSDRSWQQLLDVLANVRVEEWERRYSDINILDGGGWVLEIGRRGETSRFDGINAYPPNFEKFQNALERAMVTDKKDWHQHPPGFEGRTRPYGLEEVAECQAPATNWPIKFNSVLANVGINPKSVVLMRHQDQRSDPGRTPYDLWRDDRSSFLRYQSVQAISKRATLCRAPIWAAFVVTHNGGTMFAGLYFAEYLGLLAEDTPWPNATNRIDRAGTSDTYQLEYDDRLVSLEGKLFIGWGDGTRAWVQRADRQDKPIVELRPEFKEPEFPGFMEFIKPLSQISTLPKTWTEVLKQARGVYLLTCPRTKEQYVGSASGEEGFWQRWMEYALTGHGGDAALKSRDPSDYQVSILEVAGSSANADDILAMESRWKVKLQSREMGLNKN